MPNIDLSILNQRQTPAFYADVFANRPAAGFVGRIFVSTNTFAFYRDNGTGWDLIGGPGTGTVTGSGTTGQVTFWDGASTITGDSGLTYNGTTNALTSLGTITSTNYYVGTPSDLTRAFAAKGDASTIALWLEEYGNSGASPDIFMFKGRGSSAAPSDILVGDSTSAITSGGYVNGLLNGSTTLSTIVVNVDSTNNYANSDLILQQTYNSTTANINLRVRAIDGYVVAPNGGFETTGNINLFAGANTRRIVFDANNGIPRIFSFRTGNLPRWAFRVDGTETGSSTGADLAIRRYDDAGAFVDAPLSINRASGQSTFVKKVVIENNAGDQQLQIVSTTAPSLRIDNLQTGATKRAGLGLATAVNNFIQGSVDRDYCIFNGSTAAASPILFGIYDAAAVNVQEAARISAARNLLVGTSVDGGQKLQISGTSRLSGFTFVNHSTANSYAAAIYNTNVNSEGLAIRGGSTSSHSTLLVQTYDGNIELFKVLANGNASFNAITPDIFGRGDQQNVGISVGAASDNMALQLNAGASAGRGAQIYMGQGGTRYFTLSSNATESTLGTSTSTAMRFVANEIESFRIAPSTRNLLVNTSTDNGYKFSVNGSSYFNNTIIANETIGKNGESGTVATGTTKTINANSYGGNLSAGFIVCSAALSSGSNNAVLILAQIHTNGANAYTTILSQNDTAQLTVSLVGTQIDIVNTTGSTITYNCRFINFCNLTTWSNGI